MKQRERERVREKTKQDNRFQKKRKDLYKFIGGFFRSFLRCAVFSQPNIPGRCGSVIPSASTENLQFHLFVCLFCLFVFQPEKK